MGFERVFLRLHSQSAAFSRTERRMITLQWTVMLTVCSISWAGAHPTNVLYGVTLSVVLFGTAAVHPVCYELVLRLAGLWFGANVAARHAALTALDVTVGITLYYEAITMRQPEFAQILLLCVVALAATRYRLSRAVGITSLLSLLLLLPLLLVAQRSALPQVANSTLISSALSLYVVTYLVALIRTAERRADEIAQHNERLYHSVLGYNRELGAINNLMHVLGPQENVEAMLSQSLALICAAVDTEGGRVYRVEHGEPYLVAQQGPSAEAQDRQADALARKAIERHDLIVVPPPTPTERPSHDGALSSVAMPLLADGDVIGILQLPLDLSSTETAYNERPRMERLRILCRELAVALDNALLRDKVQQAVLLHEKNRIAQELHDTVAQILFSIGLGLEWCLRQVAEGTDVQAKLLDLKRLSGQGTTEIRSAIFTLASSIGQDEMVPAVRNLVDDLGQKYGWETNVVVTGDPQQPPLLAQNAIHRIVREGMINIYKHAQASQVMVSLRFTPTAVTVVVQDNGVGEAAAVRTTMLGQNSHFGLRAVSAQVHDLGGTFDVYDADERGIVLRALIPTRLDGAMRATPLSGASRRRREPASAGQKARTP